VTACPNGGQMRVESQMTPGEIGPSPAADLMPPLTEVTGMLPLCKHHRDRATHSRGLSRMGEVGALLTLGQAEIVRKYTTLSSCAAALR